MWYKALIQIANSDGYDTLKIAEEFKKYSDKYPYIVHCEELRKNRDTILKQVTLSSEIVEFLKSENVTKLLDSGKEIDELLNLLNNKNTFEYYSDPVQAEKDAILFNILIKPRSEVETRIPLDNRNFNYEIAVTGGIKLDFSTGFGIVFPSVESKYYAISDSVSFTVKETESNKKYSTELIGLMHLSIRKNSIYKGAISIGSGLNSTDFSNASFYGGASLIAGAKQRFILTAGIALRKEEILNKVYEINNTYNASTLSQYSLTESEYRPCFFLGITYNLTK